MADTKKDTKKVKTDEKAAETIVDEVTAESADTAETTTTDVNVTETVDVPEEQAKAAKPKPVAKENRRGSKALREENDKLKERCQDAEDKYKRLLAECENIRQRNEKESSKMYDFGAKDVLGKLLPVVDNFERAIAAIPEEDKDRPFEAGVDKIYKSLMTSLESIGVTPMNCEGEQFDPAFHNAVMHVEDENYGENVIVEEMQRGYMYKDQVLRFSMVKVAN
ncbi:MAG TPA: nucleotide exchange factor GrpE [Coprococcus sp.]|nr:nucleotide exchange factor GrpE [Coprococcus sp.]